MDTLYIGLIMAVIFLIICLTQIFYLQKEVRKLNNITSFELIPINRNTSKSTAFIDLNVKIFSIKGYLSNSFIFSFFYSIYNLIYLLIKIYRYFFGIRRYPFKQLTTLIKKLL